MPDIKEGQTATNPKTGQKVVYQGGQWHAVAGSAQAAPKAAGGIFGAGANSQTRSQAMAKIAAIRMLGPQIDTVQGLYDKTLKGFGPQSLMEYLPTPANRKFKTAADGMLPLIRQAFRVPGSGADSDKELDVLRNLVPEYTANDETNEQRMAQLRQMMAEAEKQWGPIAGMAPAGPTAISPTIAKVR